MFTQKIIKIFHSVQEIVLFSPFQNLNLGNALGNPKCYLTISWATSCQYQCVCQILSKYSKWFKSNRHFSRIFTNRPASKSSQTGPRQNLHKLSGDKIKCLIIGHFYEIQLSVDFIRVVQCLIIGHSMKFNFKFQLTFLGSCNWLFILKYVHGSVMKYNQLTPKCTTPTPIVLNASPDVTTP